MRSGLRNRGHNDSDEHSRRREAIARGKHHVESADDSEEDDEMEDVESPRDLRDEEAGDSLTVEQMKIFRILLDMQLEGTRYPDRDTMEKLRIIDDVEEMFNNIGIGTFMLKRHESYRKATCLFLATLQLHLCDSGKSTSDGSDGYISFWATGRKHYLSFREIDRVHFLPPSNRHGLGVHKDEMRALWKTIASGEYRSKSAKSALIRSPPIRYMHKAIANTLYSRQVTGNVNDSEMSMIDVALTGILPRLHNGQKLKGSTTKGGITLAMIEQLCSYQSWALMNESIRSRCSLRMGGLVTPLLYAVGFTPDETEDVALPEELDLNYLKNCGFLQKTQNGGDLIYQFTHLQFGKAQMLLPNPGWTTLRGGSNAEFNPPLSVLLQTSSTAPDYSTSPITRDDVGRSQRESAEAMDDFEHFHFEEYTSTARQSAGIKAAHEHISVLQLWNKAQDKVTNKLKKKIKKMADQIRSLQDRLSCTSGSGRVLQTTAPVAEPPSNRFEDELEPTASGDRQPLPDRPRYSSFEPRQRKRRSREHQTAGPSEGRADADLLLRRCSSVPRTAAPTAAPAVDITPTPPAPAGHTMPQTNAPAGSSTVPPYTQASMDEAVDYLFQFRR